MLILTRRIGETICIGDSICLTVYDRLCYHAMIGLLAPANARLTLGGSAIRPVVLPEGERFYLLTLQSQDAFVIGDARVQVSFKPSFDALGVLRKRQIRIGIDAPRSVIVDREEIRARRLADAGLKSPISFSHWLCRMNLSVSCRAAA